MSKPMEEADFRKYIKQIGWCLEKGKIDYNLYNGEGKLLGSIKISHGKNKKREICAGSVRKTQKLCEERGIVWPPRKK
jgi:hypothetical protein